jgi:outer membrane protease
MRVTREDVDKARADYAVAIKVADAAEEAADAAEEAAWNKYIKLRNEYEMITKEDKARADDAAAKKARYAASNAVMGNTNNGRE